MFLNSSLMCCKILPYTSIINQTLKWERRKEDTRFQLGMKNSKVLRKNIAHPKDITKTGSKP